MKRMMDGSWRWWLVVMDEKIEIVWIFEQKGSVRKTEKMGGWAAFNTWYGRVESHGSLIL